MASARGRLLGGRHPEGSCGSRSLARERGEPRAKARSVRAARAELRPRGQEKTTRGPISGPAATPRLGWGASASCPDVQEPTAPRFQDDLYRPFLVQNPYPLSR